MNYYQLETKEQDADFIDGKTIICEAVMTDGKFKTNPLHEGNKLVIRLSNGAKYMGTILRFNHAVKNGMISGVLEIKRSSRSD